MILVSCGAAKREYGWHTPKDLYVSVTFRLARRYAETSGQRWVILSAEHGVLEPDGPMLEPYDRALTDMTRAERDAWAARVRATIGGGPHVSLMGRAYEEPLERAGVELDSPMAGLGLFKRNAWLKQRLEEAA